MVRVPLLNEYDVEPDYTMHPFSSAFVLPHPPSNFPPEIESKQMSSGREHIFESELLLFTLSKCHIEKLISRKFNIFLCTSRIAIFDSHSRLVQTHVN